MYDKNINTYYNCHVETQFLTLRLTDDDALLMARLRAQTGLSKSEIVKRALRKLANTDGAGGAISLFALGEARFGRQGDVRRQSANIKSVVRGRLQAKHR